MLTTSVKNIYVYGCDEHLSGLLNIAEKVENEFSDYYTHFKEFQKNPEYRKFWAKCMSAVSDVDLLSHIKFCNDIFCIPPTKTFLTYFKNDFVTLTGDEKAVLDVYIKKSIGAFWGMVFKFALGYNGQKSVSVSMFTHFNVKTATYFTKSEKEKE